MAISLRELHIPLYLQESTILSKSHGVKLEIEFLQYLRATLSLFLFLPQLFESKHYSGFRY